MSACNLLHLPAWEPASGALNVIIETPKGCRNKYAFNPEQELFELSRVLPRGMFFPFDFGFIPSTVGPDGDPLDVLVLMDEPSFPGCRVPCQLIGVLEAEQTKAGGKVIRNDRLVAVAEQSHDHKDLHSLKEIQDHFVADIESFFGTYHRLEGGDFKVIGRYGPNRAERLVREGVQNYQDQGGQDQRPAQEAPTGEVATEAKSQPNGKKKAKKKSQG